MQLRIEEFGMRGAAGMGTPGLVRRDKKCRGNRLIFWGKMGTIKHANLRNEAKFREGLFSNQVAMGKAIMRNLWPYFRKAIFKNEANFAICDLRLRNSKLNPN